MGNRPLSLDNFTESLVGVSKYKQNLFDDGSEYKKMLEVLVRAIDGELTPRQKECVILYYGRQLSLREISEILNVAPSTVCRHLKKARDRLAKVIKYYFDKL